MHSPMYVMCVRVTYVHTNTDTENTNTHCRMNPLHWSAGFLADKGSSDITTKNVPYIHTYIQIGMLSLYVMYCTAVCVFVFHSLPQFTSDVGESNWSGISSQ